MQLLLVFIFARGMYIHPVSSGQLHFELEPLWVSLVPRQKVVWERDYCGYAGAAPLACDIYICSQAARAALSGPAVFCAIT